MFIQMLTFAMPKTFDAPSEKPLKEEVLQLWFDYMCASDRKKWNADMREHLGPRIRESFGKWRQRCRVDMIVLSNYYFEVHEDLKAFEHWYVPKEDFDLNELHVTINLENSKVELKKAFSRLLDQFHKRPPGRPSEPIARAFFQLNGDVDVKALRKTLKVHLMSRGEKVPAVKVAVEALGKVEKVLESDPARRSAQAEVSRQRRKAQRILEGVEVGRFPNPDKEPGGG
jgi:hypothetical protein